MLKPEVKQTLDKLIYQLDLCRNTLSLLENRITINEGRLHDVVDYIKTEDFNYVSIVNFCHFEIQKPHIVREVIKTTEEFGQLKTDEPHKKLSSSVGTHNLTELRRKLEERMLLKINEQNRTITAEKDKWETYSSTTEELSELSDVEIEKSGKFANLKEK